MVSFSGDFPFLFALEEWHINYSICPGHGT
nr:MAG TPA: hypothetical protein [Caudoviricetes sp.]